MGEKRRAHNQISRDRQVIILKPDTDQFLNFYKVRSKELSMAISDLEFAYAPVRTQVRDLREYL